MYSTSFWIITYIIIAFSFCLVISSLYDRAVVIASNICKRELFILERIIGSIVFVLLSTILFPITIISYFANGEKEIEYAMINALVEHYKK